MKTKTIILFVLLISIILGGCTVAPVVPIATTTPDEASPKITEQPTLTTESTQPVAPTTDVFTVVDALGREILFEKPAQRVALAGKGSILVFDALYLYPEAKSLLVTLGKGGQTAENFIAVIDPDYANKPILPPEVSPEQLMALKPDVIVLKSYLAETLGKPLESLGVPVVYVDFETPEQYWRDLKSVGQIFGNNARTEEIIDYYQGKLEEVNKAVGGLEASEKPRQLVLYYSDKDGQVAFNVPPASWMQTMLVDMAGGIPVWTEMELGKGWTKVGLEQIAAWDADQVFIINYSGDVEQTVADLKMNSEWQQLRAVKEGKLYAFPKDFISWDQPDTRWILGLTWMAWKTHPERFTGLDMDQEIRVFYDKMYGLNPDAYDKEIQPRLKGDLQ